MGKMIVFVILLTFVSGFISPYPAAAHVTAQSENFRDLQMVSLTNGWALLEVRDLVDTMNPLPRTMLMHTEDGGQSWSDRTPNGQLPGDYGAGNVPTAILTVLDDAHVWVVVPDSEGANPYAPLVWRTRDGGQTWARSEIIPVNDPTGWLMDFMDENLGWLLVADSCDETAALYHTDDGGETWVNSGVISAVDDPSGMIFEQAGEGWITLYNGVLHTSDGGKTWNTMDLPLPPNQSAPLFSQCIADFPELYEGGRFRISAPVRVRQLPLRHARRREALADQSASG